MATSTANVATAARMLPTMTKSIPRIVPLCAGVCIRFSVPRSDLEVDHLGHDEGTDAHPDQAATAGDHQPLVDEEILHVAAVDPPDQAEDDEGQGADNVGGRLGFRRHGADLELHGG